MKTSILLFVLKSITTNTLQRNSEAFDLECKSSFVPHVMSETNLINLIHVLVSSADDNFFYKF